MDHGALEGQSCCKMILPQATVIFIENVNFLTGNEAVLEHESKLFDWHGWETVCLFAVGQWERR